MSIDHAAHRHLLDPLRSALRNADLTGAEQAVASLFSTTANIHLFSPIENQLSPQTLATGLWGPLFTALPDLERRDLIVMSGPSDHSDSWVGCCGYYTGTFSHPYLDIPPTRQVATLRFHEFYEIQNNQVVQMQAVWDLPELMMQSGVWPLSPSLGREWHVPGPALQDGLQTQIRDAAVSQASKQLVLDMLDGLGKFAESGVQGMNLEQYWHPHFSWYGPSGIGTARGVEGFRKRHQIPFLNGMPDRVGSGHAGHLFSDGDFVGFTAWPGMHMTISHDGWLGIAPAQQQITMRSLDFWRCENGLIRENWVLIDLLHVYDQIGVDVLARMREMTV